MKINIFIYLNIVLLLVFLSPNNLQAQLFTGSKSKASDVEFWSGIELKKELSKKVDASFSYQLRINEHVQRFKSTFTEAGISVPVKILNTKFKLSPSIRLTKKFDSSKFIKRPVLSISSSLYKSKKMSVSYRMRFHKDFEQFSNEEFQLDFYWRNQITVDFKNISGNKKLKKIEPYLGVLLYTRAYYKGSRNDQLRLVVGVNYSAKKRQSIRLGYIYRERINVSTPVILHVIVFKINFKIKDFKK